MPSSPLSNSRPSAGTIQSYVLWHLERGENVHEIRSGAIDKFGGRKYKAIDNAVNYYGGTYGAANRLNKYQSGSSIRVNTIPTNAVEVTGYAVTVKVDFDNPRGQEGHKRESRTYRIDVPRVGTAGELRTSVREALKDEIASSYELRNSDAGRRLKNLKITSIEGI